MKRHSFTVVLLPVVSLILSAIGAAQEATPYRLTLQDAIQKALKANLSVLVADTQVEEAEGTRVRRLSAALLPRVNVQSYANLQNRNLRAFGISFPGVPDVVGPFSQLRFSRLRTAEHRRPAELSRMESQ